MIALEVITQQPLLLSHIGCVSKDYAWGGQVLCGTYLYIFSTVIPPDEGVDTVEQQSVLICFRLTGSVPSKCYFNRRSLHPSNDIIYGLTQIWIISVSHCLHKIIYM